MNAASDSHPEIHQRGSRATLPSLGGVMSPTRPRPTPSQSLLDELRELLDEVLELQKLDDAAHRSEDDAAE